MGHKQSDLEFFLETSLAVAKFVKAFEKDAYVIVDENSLEEKTGNIARRLMVEDLYKGKNYFSCKSHWFNWWRYITYLCW